MELGLYVSLLCISFSVVKSIIMMELVNIIGSSEHSESPPDED